MTKEEQKQYRKERYERLKSEGICVHCGREMAISGQTLCSACKGKEKSICQNLFVKDMQNVLKTGCVYVVAKDRLKKTAQDVKYVLKWQEKITINTREKGVKLRKKEK